MGEDDIAVLLQYDGNGRQRFRVARVVHGHVVLIVIVLAMYLAVKAESGQPKPGCSSTCGSLNIPYPFGTTIECCLDESFLITCNDTYSSSSGNTSTSRTDNKTAKAAWISNVPIVDISVERHELRVLSPIAKDCYYYYHKINTSGNSTPSLGPRDARYMLSNFPVSSKRNKFTAVGCYTVGSIISSNLEYNESEATGITQGIEDGAYEFANACGSFCSRIGEVNNGTCTSNAGCCQTPIPNNIYTYTVFSDVDSFGVNRSLLNSFNPCGYSFVVEEDAFNLSSSDLLNLQNNQTVPMVLDWAVGNITCEQAKSRSTTRNSTSYACLAIHSKCHDSNNGHGYQCSCTKGYQGNPYLLDGCQDINECEVSNPCIIPKSCSNLPGSVHCSCPKGNKGDGMVNGTGCSSKSQLYLTPLAIAMGICIGFLLLLMGGFWIYWRRKKRKLIQLREKFFQQNGGILLEQQLSSYQGSIEMTKIFTEKELKKATDNYEESKVIGQGANGTVYKGVLLDNTVVAIKKSRICDQSQIEQFINELIVLSRINHRNVVKLLGCCLETQVPLLVYEFITNGTLSSHIHINKGDHSPSSSSSSFSVLKLPWKMRLKIATETAGALAYLHSAASMPIIHRDVKTTNILLDENYTAKVSDFGVSRLIPIGQTTLTTLVKGTVGYLDPEYFQSSQLTEKSDVYSFGVVLAELLTGEEAVFFEQSERRRNLAKHFVSSMEEDHLLEILDDQMDVDVNEESIEQLKRVAGLANKCLREKGEERPSMKDVATELEGLITHE